MGKCRFLLAISLLPAVVAAQEDSLGKRDQEEPLGEPNQQENQQEQHGELTQEDSLGKRAQEDPSYNQPASAADQEDQTISVFDAEQHPESPVHSAVYPKAKLPLDVQLSWTNRFKGNEEFNEMETLASNNMMAGGESDSMMSDEMSHGEMSHGMHKGMDGKGVVKTIRADQGKVKIEHGPIDKYGMPAMTMMFTVKDPSQLEGLSKGDEVGFDVDNSSGGFVVTNIMTMAMMKEKHKSMMEGSGDTSGAGPSGMDATGVVKTIRAEQGKVKIEHGPIDKYGMPAMTMVFKVQNPADLENLEKGMAVEFDIDNSSGGFEITRIKPVKQ
ncbi:MAG: copper-binding protein [Gammaproteobacteria bacterium]|nr:copper-binding protein [Gammaproteobacteria bacterium]